MDPDRARQRLKEDRARIERELEAIGAQEPGEEPEDSGDQASELDQAGKDEAIREELQRTLEAIERAEAAPRGRDATASRSSAASRFPTGDSRRSRGPTDWSMKSPAGAARRPRSSSGGDQQVVEELRREMRLEHLVVQSLQRQIAAEREAAPPRGHLVGLGARLEGPHGPAVDRREQLLATDPDLGEVRAARRTAAARRERRRARRPPARERGRWPRPRGSRGEARRASPGARAAPASRRCASGSLRESLRSGRARRRRRGSRPAAAPARTQRRPARDSGCDAAPHGRRRGRSSRPGRGASPPQPPRSGPRPQAARHSPRASPACRGRCRWRWLVRSGLPGGG